LALPQVGSLQELSDRLTHWRPQQRWNPPECRVPSLRVAGPGCSDGPCDPQKLQTRRHVRRGFRHNSRHGSRPL